MSNPINLGTIAQGEVPFPLVHTFTDTSSNPIDLTGYAATWTGRVSGGQAATRTVTVIGGGQVQVAWSTTDFSEPGTGIGELWVIGASNRFAARFTYLVQPTLEG